MFLIGIILLIITALIFILPPLLKSTTVKIERRDTSTVKATRQQIQDIERDISNDLISSEQVADIRREAEDTLLMELGQSKQQPGADKSKRFYQFTAAVITLFVPAIALLIYLSVGTPAAVTDLVSQPSSPSDPGSGASMEQLIAKLEQRLIEQPDDEQGWLVLAQTNMMMERFDKAAQAMKKLHQLTGDNPDILARYADALTMANDGRFNQRSQELIERSLSLDANHVHSLWLAGMSAYQKEQYQQAIDFFQTARVNSTSPEDIVQIDNLIKAASEKSGIVVAELAPASPPLQVGVNVKISPQLSDQFNPDDSLFIFAKAVKGPPMPLAVSRHKAHELPLVVHLSDAMAMMPELKLSAFDQVIISARISKSGQPTASPGDLQGESAIINPQDSEQIDINIDQVISAN